MSKARRKQQSLKAEANDFRLPFDIERMKIDRPDPSFTAPDLTGAVEGWRAWNVDLQLPVLGPPKLYSASNAYYWKPQQASRAECVKNPEHVPGEQCSCGFYSANSLSHLLSMGYHTYNPEFGQVTIVGQVANWGKVIVGTQGWRSEYAYPVRLWVPFEAFHLLEPIQEAYAPKHGAILRNWLKPVTEIERDDVA